MVVQFLEGYCSCFRAVVFDGSHAVVGIGAAQKHSQGKDP